MRIICFSVYKPLNKALGLALIPYRVFALGMVCFYSHEALDLWQRLGYQLGLLLGRNLHPSISCCTLISTLTRSWSN
jgi:hypothetical protein